MDAFEITVAQQVSSKQRLSALWYVCVNGLLDRTHTWPTCFTIVPAPQSPAVSVSHPTRCEYGYVIMKCPSRSQEMCVRRRGPSIVENNKEIFSSTHHLVYNKTLPTHLVSHIRRSFYKFSRCLLSVNCAERLH